MAFYLYLLRPPAGWSLGVLLVLAGLTFVPLRYLYPSRGGRASFLVGFGAVWALSLVAILWLWERAPHGLLLGSLAFPAYYLGASWAISAARWRRHIG